MKTRTPYDRNDLKIRRRDKVVEIGSGHNPMYRSDVIVEKYINDNSHRCGDIKIYPHQTFINADGENLPFKDQEFDYAICNQVLEHAEHPDLFMNELSRVARRGYIETPSLLGEHLFPKYSHKWVILDIDGKLVFFEKSKMPGNYENNYGSLFLNYLPYQSLIYKMLWLTEGSIMNNRYEWKDGIDYIVNPAEEYYLSFFTRPWDMKMAEKLFPRRSIIQEITKTFPAMLHLAKYEIKRIKKHSTMTIESYAQIHNKKIS